MCFKNELVHLGKNPKPCSSCDHIDLSQQTFTVSPGWAEQASWSFQPKLRGSPGGGCDGVSKVDPFHLVRRRTHLTGPQPGDRAKRGVWRDHDQVTCILTKVIHAHDRDQVILTG